ncbi:unnamed protein product, partial [Polarella glacialis]
LCPVPCAQEFHATGCCRLQVASRKFGPPRSQLTRSSQLNHRLLGPWSEVTRSSVLVRRGLLSQVAWPLPFRLLSDCVAFTALLLALLSLRRTSRAGGDSSNNSSNNNNNHNNNNNNNSSNNELVTRQQPASQYQERHKLRMSWRPPLYFQRRAGEKHQRPRNWPWARSWQSDIHQKLMEFEDVHLHPDCFVAPSAMIIAPPSMTVEIGKCSSIAAHVCVHGKVSLGDYVCVNHGASLDGGAGGIIVGDGTRIATGAKVFAWNHGIAADRFVHEQPTESKGIRIGVDVWICANAGITDGVTIGDYAVVAMGAVVCHDVPAW